jgi:uncharacterized membrane protein YhaH (DUF805 family)
MNTATDLKPIEYYFDAFKRYAQFQGRARRRAFWYFTLFNVIVLTAIQLVAGILAAASGDVSLSTIVLVYQLGVFIPGLAVGVRRLHDTGRSGWWLLVPIVNIVFMAEDSAPGENAYGAPVKEVTARAVAGAQGGAASMSSLDQIERLAALRDKGILTDDEFLAKKAALL